MPDAPLILTLGFSPDDQARFDRLRQAHFPVERNQIPAHLTLFHHLPGAEAPLLQDQLAAACAAQPAGPVRVVGLRSLGRGVAFTVEAPGIARLRTALARDWHNSLTAQDRQGWRPHITIQNKAAPADARRLLAAMQAGFTPFDVRAEALLLWRYLGGPWELVSTHPFSPPP